MSGVSVVYRCPKCRAGLSREVHPCPVCEAARPKSLKAEARAGKRAAQEHRVSFRRGSRRTGGRREEPSLVSEFLRSDPGNPLGVGMPSGSPLREDGDTHREGWMRIVRRDPCAYCGRPAPAGTVDHIVPKSTAPAGTGHVWLNYSAACPACNASKSDESLLMWLVARRGVRVHRTSRNGPDGAACTAGGSPRTASEAGAKVSVQRAA